jgi:hypothetical protein
MKNNRTSKDSEQYRYLRRIKGEKGKASFRNAAAVYRLTLGVGNPVAAQSNTRLSPSTTVSGDSFVVVMVGGIFTCPHFIR